MPKYMLSIIVLVLAISACGPVSLPQDTPPMPTTPPLSAPESEPVQPEPTAIVTEAAEPTLTPTDPQEPPSLPTEIASGVAETLPTAFDKIGYQNFAITRTYFPGFVDFLGERNHTIGSQSFSPDGNLLAVTGCWGSMDNFLDCETSGSGFLVLVDVNSGELVAEIPQNESWPYAVDFSADGMYLLYSTKQQQVILWDITAQKPAALLNATRRSTSRSYAPVAALPDGSGYAALIAKTLYMWDPGGALRHEIPTGQAATNAYLFYSLDGSRLLTFSRDRSVVEVFNTAGFNLVNRIETGAVRWAALSPDGHILAVLDGAGSLVNIWDLDKGQQIARVDLDGTGYALQFNPAGDLLIVTGIGNLDTVDGYSRSGILVETQTWQKLDELYSFAGYGPIEFSLDGSRMMVFDSALTSLWELPDKDLVDGLEVVRAFQDALSTGDYAGAAALFDATVYGAEYFASIGIDVDDLAGSFEQLCASGEIFCQPVSELVMMGHDWYDLVYLVRMEGEDGGAFTSPDGAQIISLTVAADAAGNLRVTFPGMDY